MSSGIDLSSAVDPPVPPDDLAQDAFAARLYAMLAPLAQLDEQYGWALAIYINAIGTMYELVEDWVRDTPDGPGWSVLLDVNRCSDDVLPWLAQFAGVRLLPNLTPAEQRARILSTDGFRRGTLAALRGAVIPTLTGLQSLLVRERNHDPADTPNYAYYLTVRTYTSETPDPTATLNALLAQKPAGIVLDFATLNAQDYATLKLTHTNYAAVKSAYATYALVPADRPF
jgi:hypothetical protein